jgi:hypothetical protein
LVNKAPEILKPCGIRSKVAKVLVAVLQRAAIKSNLNQEVLVRHRKGIVKQPPSLMVFTCGFKMV